MSEPVPLHVTQMVGFVPPPLDPQPLTVWNMQPATTEQSAPVAAPASTEDSK